MADADTKGNMKNEPRSIKLPGSVQMFGNLKNAKRFAIDIGNYALLLIVTTSSFGNLRYLASLVSSFWF